MDGINPAESLDSTKLHEIISLEILLVVIGLTDWRAEEKPQWVHYQEA